MGVAGIVVLLGFFNPVARSQEKGTIQGVVTYHGPVPKSPVADDAGQRRDLVRVDRATGGLQDVVAYLDFKSGSKGKPEPGNSDGSLPPVVVDQIDSTFEPHLIAVRAGQAVTFTNSDPANHNVRASSPVSSNAFNVFTGAGGSHRHRFAADAERRPVRLGCDIHPWMRGWVFVFDHPHYSVTDDKGRFAISGVPAGEYELVLRQPDLNWRATRTIAVEAGSTNRVNIEVPREQIDPR